MLGHLLWELLRQLCLWGLLLLLWRMLLLPGRMLLLPVLPVILFIHSFKFRKSFMLTLTTVSHGRVGRVAARAAHGHARRRGRDALSALGRAAEASPGPRGPSLMRYITSPLF